MFTMDDLEVMLVFSLLIAKIATLIAVVVAIVISEYLQLVQHNKSRKSFLVGKCNGTPFLIIVLVRIS